jgi:NADP-dependent 3-hydroxy-3-methylglutaryl-CoA reductase
MFGGASESRNRGQRKSPRRFYRSARAYNVLFQFDGRTYHGVVRDVADHSLGVAVDERVPLKPGQTVPVLYIGQPSKDHAISNVEVARVGRKSIGFLVPDKAQQKQLKGIWHRLSEGATKGGTDRESNAKRLPSFSRNEHFSAAATASRQRWARNVSGSELKHIPETSLEPESLAGNIENYIGAVQVPVGIAGPIQVNGSYTDGYVPVPLATTEGALVSSTTRGAFACNLSGGVNVHVNRQVMHRSPVFFCKDMQGAINLEQWILQNVDAIREQAESVSSVARLTDVEPTLFGRTLHVRFTYSTGDASGQNMTTACTWVACEWIAKAIRDDEAIRFDHYHIEGNMSGDKKMNSQNIIRGRGTSVVAECFLKERVLKRVLHVSGKQLVEGWQTGQVGAAEIGMVGSDVNAANVIAAIFTATGQDIACVYESSGAVFSAMEEEGGVRVTLHIPALIIGTLGGGTHLPTQREALELMKCYGANKVFRFAEIIAAASLALAISTLASIYTNEFVSAHETLGRNRPTNKLARSELNERFLTRMLREEGQVVSCRQRDLDSRNGIISSMLQEKGGKSVSGLFGYDLEVEGADGGRRELSAVLKVKGNDSDFAELAVGIARLSGEDRLPGLYEANLDLLGYTGSNVREIAFYRHARPEVRRHLPEIYGELIDEERDIQAVLMEDLSGCSHRDTENDPGRWDDASIRRVLEGLAEIHSAHFDDRDSIPAEVPVHEVTPEALSRARECLREATRYNAGRYPELITEELHGEYRRFVERIEQHAGTMAGYHRTLTHNDFHPRNVCLREVDGERRLVAYDWELAAYQNPQHDLIEFLIYALDEGSSYDDFLRHAGRYFEELQRRVGRLDRDRFFEVLELNALELGLIRYNIYLLTNNLMKYDYIDRVYRNLAKVILKQRAAGTCAGTWDDARERDDERRLTLLVA